jgi:hypothetical protein
MCKYVRKIEQQGLEVMLGMRSKEGFCMSNNAQVMVLGVTAKNGGSCMCRDVRNKSAGMDII